MFSEQQTLDDGRVTLRDEVTLQDPRLFNHDLAPTPMAERTWSTYNFAALWVSMAHCIPTYMMASGLIANGMNWKQALFTILLGNVIVLVPILLNSHPGTRYGIPFPVFARAAYGVFGSNVPALMRAIVACGWFGIQCWIGGKALHTFFAMMWPGWVMPLGDEIGGYTVMQWISFALFWAMNILIVYRGMDLLRKVENLAAPYVLVMTGLLVWWAIRRAHGLGPILSQGGTLHSSGAFMKAFVPGLTAMIGFWATLSLNMPDFTRFGRSQREQTIGQVVALPSTMTVFAAMGVMITSAGMVIYGKLLWDPMDLAMHFESRVLVAIAMFTAVIATLAVNIAANVVSPANDFANAFPKHVTFARGGLITGIIGVAMCPWKLLENADTYINKWLVGYSGAMGAIAAVLIADYWLVKRTQLDLADLYRADGRYSYGTRVSSDGRERFKGSGWNPVAIGSTVLGCMAAWIGAIVKPLAFLFEYGWFLAAGVSFLSYWLGMRLLGDRAGASSVKVSVTT